MKDRITIGIFDDSYFPVVDGVALVVDNYARRMCKYANVVVFVPEILGKKYDDSVFPYKIVRCKSMRIPFCDYSAPTPKITLNFKKKIKECNIDIIHIHSPFTLGVYALKYAKKKNIPVVSTLHSQFDQNIMRLTKSKKITDQIVKQVMKTYNKSDEVWTLNNEMERLLCEDYKYKRKPLIMKNATDMVYLEDVKKIRKEINKKYKLNDRESILLFVGRINKLKNILFIVDALRILKNEKIKFKMLFVGSGQDERMLRSYIKENDLEKDIIMCGKIMDREELAKIYSRADLFLFPSLYDANSLVQIEAASQKTPTVFLNSVTSCMVTNMENGIITNDNIVEYADAIIKLLKDKKLYKKISEGAYKDLYIHWDDAVKNVYNRYIELINEKNNK